MERSSARASRAALVAIVALVTSFSLAPAAQGAGQFRAVAVPEMDGKPVHVSKALLQRERAAIERGESRMVSIVVRLEAQSLAANRGKVAGLAATSPSATGARRLDTRSAESQQYLKYLGDRQLELRSRLTGAVPKARVVHQFKNVLNAMSMLVPEDQISAVAALPGVAAIYEDRLLQLNTDVTPAFIGAPTLWNKLGGQGKAGEGVIVGVLDTGIWPEHPSLSDPDPLGGAYPAPPAPSGGPRQCEFSGGGNPGPAATCNNKLIGADRFMSTYDALNALLPGEYTSARDDDGHGTHTATTAAGNQAVAASIYGEDFGLVSGIAPRAHVMAYKVCGDVGCYSSDSAAAVDRAIADGVDVINFSISGGNDPFGDVVSLAFLDAYNAGVFVAASAGNSGPGANTTGHREPWTTTVAASTSDRQFATTVQLVASNGDILNLTGASLTAGIGSAPVYVPPVDTLCQSPFPAGSAAGMIVVCQRGVNARVAKGYNALQGGAVGMILYNPSLQGIATDNHFLPAVHLEGAEGAQLTAFLGSHTGVTASFPAGSAAAYQGDVVAPFSSRGGPGLALGIAKPDVTAPGVQILAGTTPTPATVDGGATGQLFMAIQGTSMSSPHVAGAAALLRDLQPTWTPGQIKSALMLTATGAVVKEDGSTPADPFDVGSGRIDLHKAAHAGLLIDETGANFVSMAGRLWDANYPSLYVPNLLGTISVTRTLKNTRPGRRTWTTRVTAPSDLKVKVPGTFDIARNGSRTIRITVDGSRLAVGEKRHALIELRSKGEHTLRFPITVVRGASAVPLTKNCVPAEIGLNQVTDCTLTITNTTFDPVHVDMTDKMPNQLQLVRNSVTNALAVGGNYVVFSGNVAPAQPPSVAVADATGGSPAGYLPLSLFGIGSVAGVGDETIVNFTVPAFTYATETYTRVGIVSNGYLVVGGGSTADVKFINQSLPDAAAPNNVIAPYWTDLNFASGGAVRIGTLTDGVSTWLVVDWENAPEYSTPSNRHSFQTWIRLGAVEDITLTYGAQTGNGDGGFLTVGAENRFGNRGQNHYVDGAGTLPIAGTELRVSSTPGGPGETRTITYKAKGKAVGAWRNCAEMDSDSYYGTQTACTSGRVRRN